MSMRQREADLTSLASEVTSCAKCARLVDWREQVAANPRASFAGEEYWGRAVPGFGDPDASLVISGLAPAAHGANRTGRMFTGDRSGDWLFAALYRAGFADRQSSTARSDGLRLDDCYVTAVVKCAPPTNRPTPEERDNCVPYLASELSVLRPRVVIALGSFAWDGTLRAAKVAGWTAPAPKPRFGHLAKAELAAHSGPVALVGSYHPSQQNTFTGRLTETMFDAVFDYAREVIAAGE